MKISCIAIDDEPLALDKIKEFVKKVDFLNLLKSFSDPVEALGFLKEQTVDLIFLDIQMDKLTGIEFMENVKPDARVIITTAHNQYALKGYDLQVQDYLLKPFPFERFLKAVNNAAEHIKLTRKNLQTDKESLFVKSGMVLKQIRFDDILYIEGMKDYLSIWTKEGRTMTLMNFTNILNLLPEKDFIRIHRSFIVPISKIEEISKNRVKISKQLIPIGETYKSIVNEKLGFSMH